MNGEERLFITLCVLLGALIVCVAALWTAPKKKPEPPRSSRDLSRDLSRWLGVALALVALGGFGVETNARGCTRYTWDNYRCSGYYMSDCETAKQNCVQKMTTGGQPAGYFGCYAPRVAWHGEVTTECRKDHGWEASGVMVGGCCDDACLLDSLAGCPEGQVWDSQTCSCQKPPCADTESEAYKDCLERKCITYWNDGQGGKESLKPNEIPLTSVANWGGGGGYYAHMVIESHPCACFDIPAVVEDAPATCQEMDYCPQGQNECIMPNPNSSSSGANSSSSSAPNCTCIGCFGGNCAVMCDDGSTRTCVGDFSTCAELKNSPTWTTCTEPISSPSSSPSSGASSSDSQSSPSSQANDLDALNAIIDTLHHSNQLQEVGHQNQKDIADKLQQNNEQNGGFFAAALSYLKGLLGNTQSQVNKQNATNNKLDDIANKLEDIKNRPRDTTIINISSPSGGGGETGGSDTTIVNISLGIDSNIGAGKWDTATATAGYKNSYDSAAAYWDSTAAAADGDTIPSEGEMMQAYKDGFTSFRDSGAGKMYRDTLGAIAEKFIDNGTLTGSGSNSCPSVLTRSMSFNIAGITASPNLTLGTYLCTPVFGGITGWTLGRTLLRALVSIACMFFLFKCATGTLGGDE